MKSSYLSLTFIIAFLPAYIPTFNIFKVGSNNETLFHQHHESCFHDACPVHQSSIFQEKKIAFGAEMARQVLENQLKGEADYKIKKVVIDPGHGGKDPGCSGVGTQEKKIALSVALKLGRSLERAFPEVQFIYTRKSDVFVPLNRRAQIANDHKADLFISIHCNNFPKSANVKGSETYVLGLHRVADNLEVAKRENEAIYYEDNYEETYGGYDPNSAEGHIILSMYQNAYLEQSISFANKIEHNIKKNTAHRSRGVRQAGFLVLRETTMPSVLVETGYLSNANDNKFLSTANGQAQVVNSIAQAFAEYKKEVEKGATSVTPNIYANTVQTQPKAKDPIYPVQPKLSTPKPAPKTGVSKKTPAVSKNQSTKNHNNPANQALIIPSNKNNSSNSSVPAKVTTDVQYKVLLTSANELIDTDQNPWTEVPYSVQIIKDGSMFKYLAIGFEDFNAAVTAKSHLRKIGFKEAFLVAYQNGKRIDMKEALSKTGR